MAQQLTMKFQDGKTTKIPLYTDRREIQAKEKEIIRLFDINFGKDGRFFISLYYGDGICRHHLTFAGNKRLPKGLGAQVTRMRKLYGAKGMGILMDYLKKGYRGVERKIQAEDKYRIYGISDIKEYYAKKQNNLLGVNEEPYISDEGWNNYKTEEESQSQEYTYFKEEYIHMCTGGESFKTSVDEDEERKQLQSQD